MNKAKSLIFGALLCLLTPGCEDKAWNDPYPNEPAMDNTLYSAFGERPKHLDPAKSYSSGEWGFIAQIYEPPLQYHYLKRPYVLEPVTLSQMPEVEYFDKTGRKLPKNTPSEAIHISRYTLTLKEGMFYQPHPAFYQDEKGQRVNLSLSQETIDENRRLSDFSKRSTRELIAEDYIYQIKRLADPKIHSPIYGFMANYIQGLSELHQTLQQAYLQPEHKEEQRKALDLRDYPLTGVKLNSRYQFSIDIKGKYPQFKYWLAMPFFAPVPWEAIQFYAQPGMKDRNISLDWYPVGSGPFMLTENNPERRMILERNPHYHGENYPSEGEKEDKDLGLLVDANQPMPFLERVIYSLEKEDIPYWNKFLQGYYDNSGISSDNFDNAVDFTPGGGLKVTPALHEKSIRLQTSISPTIMYWGFNMLDEVVGGQTLESRKLRQAIAIAFHVEEFISIFTNGRGEIAHSPIPPGIFGHPGSINHKVYTNETGQLKRHSLEKAKSLLKEAGYPNGRHHQTGEPLILYFDTVTTGDPDEKSVYAWMRKQFQQLNIQLVVRATDYNRFQEKMRQGRAQLYFWGWNADYPDPENFLFMFYGPNAKVPHGGENASNYQNQAFDQLFVKMKSMENTPERQLLIDEMLKILEEDLPWIWGFHPKSFALYHDWYRMTKPNGMARNTLKYVKIDKEKRYQNRLEWNQPVIWPFGLIIALFVMILYPAFHSYRKKEQRVAKRD